MFKYTNKIRIVIFLPNFSFGGASESLFKLIKFLSKNNFSILVISIGKNHYKSRLEELNCKIIELNSKRTIFSIFKIRKILKNEIKIHYKKIIFLSNIHYANVISIISSWKLKNLKIILTERSSLSELHISKDFISLIKNKIIFLLASIFYRYSDLIVTNSEYEKKYILKNFNIKKILTIHPPSIEKVLPVKNKTKLKQKLNIIYVGRLSKEKGIFIILEALNKIKNKKKFNLKIYGDGKERNDIQKKIIDYNLKKNVYLCGNEISKSKIFKNADLFLNASLFEGLPNALVQSINYNVYPICSRSPGGNIEVIKNGKFGVSFKTNDPIDLSKKIIKYDFKKNTYDHKLKIKHLIKFSERYSNKMYLKILKKI